MWKLHRVYLRELLRNLFLTAVVLFGVVLLISMTRGVRRAEGFDLWTALRITWYWAADSLAHLVPISFLVANVLTFARASQDRELTALQAAGVAPWAPLKAAALVGIWLSFVTTFLLHSLIPDTHYWKNRVVADTVRAVLLETGITGDQFQLGEGVTIAWEDRGGAGELRDLVLFVDDGALGFEAVGLRGVLRAESARVSLDAEEDLLSCRFDGLRDPLGQAELRDLTITRSLATLATENRRREGDRDLTSQHLMSEVARGVHPLAISAEYVYFRRIAFALLPLALGPIGFALGRAAGDRGRAQALLLTTIPLGVFYAGDLLGTELVRSTDQPLFACTSFLMLLLGAGYSIWRVARR